jgi:type IV pilus assembly protein PilB
MAKFKESGAQSRLEELRIKEAEDLASILSEKYGVPYTDLGIVPINTKALELIEEKDAREAGVACFQIRGMNVDIAILTPNNEKMGILIGGLKKRAYKINIHIASQRSLEKAWERYKEISFAKKSSEGMIEISDDNINRLSSLIKNTGDLQNEIEKEMKSSDTIRRVTAIIEIIMAGAIATRASDVHIEPKEESVRLRFRLDGILHDVSELESSIYKLVLSRIKILSGVKLNIKKKAQDGRLSIRIKETDIEIRTSILPEIYGESVVMRILNPDAVQLDIKTLGMDEKLQRILEEEITKPNGMILTTGPTGSGKTTSLYSFIKKVNKEGVKIITIEDPVEYHLKGITQTQAQEGYGFLDGLRAALRQDPDVIMVGEIRDKETASIAINSALTGHLVFSTLHTNNAAGAIPRLLDLGIEPKVMGSALSLALAQRLIRILCEHCKKEYNFTAEEISLVKPILEKVPQDYKDKISDWENKKIFKPTGCNWCNNTGYRGRSGIFEGILMDNNIEKTILENPGENDIWQASYGQGILRMKEHGVIKVLNGETSLEEIMRVVDLSED